MDQTYGPYRTTKCLNIQQNMEVVDSNRGRMYVSGQHNPMGWDTLNGRDLSDCGKAGQGPDRNRDLESPWTGIPDGTNPVPSYEACVEPLKKMMNWNWHPAGAKKLPTAGCTEQASAITSARATRFRATTPNFELRNGVVHLASKGPIIGHYGLEANAMVVAEELGLEYKDIHIDLDHHEIYRPYGGGSDGSTASSWAMKECANILKQANPGSGRSRKPIILPRVPDVMGMMGGSAAPPKTGAKSLQGNEA